MVVPFQSGIISKAISSILGGVKGQCKKGILFFNFLFHFANFFPATPLGSPPRPVDGNLRVKVFNTPTNARGPYMLVNLLSADYAVPNTTNLPSLISMFS